MNSVPLTTDDICRMNHKNKNKSKFTCIPIGLTQGQFNLNAFKIAEQYKWFQMRSACLMAFCHLYIQDPLKWSSQTINKILINGAKVVKDNYLSVTDNGPLDCVLNVENYVAKIRIEVPFLLDTVGSSPSLIDTVHTFFNSHQHGLFRCLNVCYLIWKTNGIYFVFDGQGSGSAADDKNGVASLVCTESLRDVSKLLKTLSSIKSDDCYSLSAIKMKHFRDGMSTNAKPRIQYVGTNPYKIVNDCFAILSGKFHIEQNGFQSLRKRQSITVNLMALIYHTIQPVNSWTSQLIDKIILLGTKLFHECKKSPQGEVTIQHLPRAYNVLDYKFKIDYKPYYHSGQMSYSLDEMKKNLLMYLQRALSTGPITTSDSVFIQTNSMFFAVWESNQFFYLFDAYERNAASDVTDGQPGTACIQMHGSLESLCDNLAASLNAFASNDGFVLHGINVMLVTKGGGPVGDTDLELINAFMDDLFWAEMNNVQESSARSDEICNLDESSDDDIFMETVLGEKRTMSSIQSSDSRSTTSFVSGSGSSDSRSDSASKTSDANTQSNDDSDSQASGTRNVRTKSPKNRKESRKGDDADDVDDADADGKGERSKGKRSKKSENVDDDDAGSDGLNENQKGEKRSKKSEKTDDDGDDGHSKKGKDEKRSKKSEKVVDAGGNENKKGEKRSKKSKDVDDAGGDAHNKNRKGKQGKGKGKGKDNGEKNASKQSLVVVESSSGTEASITKLLTTSFKIADRVLLATEWGDFFVIFESNNYFLVEGCLCDSNALIQMNVNELDNSKMVSNIDAIVSEIMQLKSSDNSTIGLECADATDVARSTEIMEVQPPFSSSVDTPMWELIEGMIELMKTTAKFDKIKSELV